MVYSHSPSYRVVSQYCYTIAINRGKTEESGTELDRGPVGVARGEVQTGEGVVVVGHQVHPLRHSWPGPCRFMQVSLNFYIDKKYGQKMTLLLRYCDFIIRVDIHSRGLWEET